MCVGVWGVCGCGVWCVWCGRGVSDVECVRVRECVRVSECESAECVRVRECVRVVRVSVS